MKVKMYVPRLAIAILFVLLMIPISVSAKGKEELKIATWEDVNTLDPGWLTSVEREFTIMNCIFNGLVKYKEGTWDVVPDLAESWEMSADGKQIMFQLRKGVMFHKGYGEMTAEDVKFSFERIIAPDASSPEKGYPLKAGQFCKFNGLKTGSFLRSRGSGNAPTLSKVHSNKSGNFLSNNRSALVVPSARGRSKLCIAVSAFNRRVLRDLPLQYI